MYYTRELAPSWIACDEVKVLKKVKIQKNSEEGGEKPSKRAQIKKTIFSAIRKGR